MEDSVPFASRIYGFCFALMLFSRGMDFLSTWVATPNLVLEGNPIAKKLGWRWGILFNLAVCFGLAFWPASAIAVSTTSLMVAARNFQSAWLMRTMGEENYRDWYVERIQDTPITLYLFCLAGNALLPAAIGLAVIYFSATVVPFAIGLGIVAYGAAVAFFTLLAVWRLRRATARQLRELQQIPPPAVFVNGVVLKKSGENEVSACEAPEPQGK
jgi:hypothetical protein